MGVCQAEAGVKKNQSTGKRELWQFPLKKLRSAVRANTARVEQLERQLEEREQIFDALSDCVFIFVGSSLFRSNKEGSEVLESAKDREGLLEALRNARPGPVPAMSDWIQGVDGRGEPMALRVAMNLPVRLKNASGRLVIAENPTGILREEARFTRGILAERKRIARDLHDGMAQILTFLTFKAKSLELKASRHRDRERMADIRRAAQSCASTATRLVHDFYSNKSK